MDKKNRMSKEESSAVIGVLGEAAKFYLAYQKKCKNVYLNLFIQQKYTSAQLYAAERGHFDVSIFDGVKVDD